MADLRTKVSVIRERAVLACAMLPDLALDPRDPLAELRSLADTAGANCVAELIQVRTKPDSSTFIGKGKVDELAALVQMHEAQVIIFENDLSPAQLRNVEQVTECKVIDRSELILDIFATRARTFEAKLQVELAQLEYTYPRLRAMWSHLERIAGGAPAGIGTRGPGEQQLEIDRRIVQRKKAQLQREIDRGPVNASRREVEAAQHSTTSPLGLVGYTNAGKSTLFNTLTEAGVLRRRQALRHPRHAHPQVWKLGDGDERHALRHSRLRPQPPPPPRRLLQAPPSKRPIHADLLLIVLDAVRSPGGANACSKRCTKFSTNIERRSDQRAPARS